MSRVIVVGAGIAGLACARELLEAGHRVTVRERASSVGGRMASPKVHDRPVDSGASYFTASDPDFVVQAEDWCARGLARRWTDRFPSLTSDGLSEPKPGPWRYATPGGLRSLVADLAHEDPEPALMLRSPVSLIQPGPAVDGESTDAVVLAMPDPQAARLLDERLADVLAQVATRRWEPVLALISVFPERAWPEMDGVFVNEDPTLAWIADDGSRRGDGAPVLVSHSTPTFAATHLHAPDNAAPEMESALERLLDCGKPLTAHVHRWTSARPADPRDEPYFFGSDRVGLAGDGWGSPRVETAWLSGRALGKRIAKELSGS